MQAVLLGVDPLVAEIVVAPGAGHFLVLLEKLWIFVDVAYDFVIVSIFGTPSLKLAPAFEVGALEVITSIHP